MKILLLSDSHGDTAAVCEAVRREAPDQVLHMGDHAADCGVLDRAFPLLPVRAVRGNCDMGSTEAEEAVLSLGGKRVMITHGHRYRVKAGTDLLETAAAAEGVDAVLFGHTHIPIFTMFAGIYVINPGSLRYGRCYGVLQIENGQMSYHPGTLPPVR